MMFWKLSAGLGNTPPLLPQRFYPKRQCEGASDRALLASLGTNSSETSLSETIRKVFRMGCCGELYPKQDLFCTCFKLLSSQLKHDPIRNAFLTVSDKPVSGKLQPQHLHQKITLRKKVFFCHFCIKIRMTSNIHSPNLSVVFNIE